MTITTSGWKHSAEGKAPSEALKSTLSALPHYTYRWSTGDTTAGIQIPLSGMAPAYRVTVTDARQDGAGNTVACAQVLELRAAEVLAAVEEQQCGLLFDRLLGLGFLPGEVKIIPAPLTISLRSNLDNPCSIVDYSNFQVAWYDEILDPKSILCRELELLGEDARGYIYSSANICNLDDLFNIESKMNNKTVIHIYIMPCNGRDFGYFMEKKPKEQPTQNDHYFDELNGKYLGSDGSTSNNYRLISKEKFEKIKHDHGGTTSSEAATTALGSMSRVILINNSKIQTDMQIVRDKSQAFNKEYKMHIYLDRENAIITSEVSMIIGENDNSTLDYIPAPSTGANLYQTENDNKRHVLLSQLHGHPESDDPNTYTLKTMSEKDKNSAMQVKIPIYAVDAMIGKPGQSAFIHRVSPNGKIENRIGKTIGGGTDIELKKGGGQFNIGKDSLDRSSGFIQF